MLGVLMIVGIVPAVGAETAEKGEMSAAEKAAQIEELLEFSDRLHEMTDKYSVAYTKDAADTDPYAAARVIVKSAGKVDYTGSLAHVSGHNDLHIIQYATPAEARKAVKAFRATKGIDYAEPDAIMHIEQQPHHNDFMSWGFGEDHIGTFAFTEWLLQACGDDVDSLPEIVVGIVDTGIDSDHPYFADRLVPGGYNFAYNTDDPEDDEGHGSHVAGTVCDGTLPNVKVMAIKVLSSAGTGSTSDVALGMEWAYMHGCSVVNMSLGGPADGDMTMENIINAGADSEAKTVYCVAAGNESDNAMNHSPANVERACTVAAHNQSKHLCWFSNYGDIVDITAPGENIVSVRMGGGTTSMDGTSMATPHVAAASALIRSFSPAMAADDVIQTLKDNAVPASFEGGGAGLMRIADIPGAFTFDPNLNGEDTFLHFISEGQYPWDADETGAWSGNAGVDGSESVLTAVSGFKAYEEISFEYNVSCEEDFDIFKFLVNGEEVFSTSGETGWQTFTYMFPTGGTKELSWIYEKDGSGADGEDKAMIRNVCVRDTVSSVLNTGKANFLFEGDWVVDGDSAKSGNAGINNSVSTLTTQPQHAEKDLTFMFNYKVSCGAGDKFQFLVNDEVIFETAENTDWTEYRYTVENADTYSFAFKYIKDGSGAAGDDCAYVKAVDFDFTLDTVLNVEDGDLMFHTEEPYPWIVYEDYAKSGNYGIGNTSSVLTLTLDLSKGDSLSFRYKVTSEPQFDWFNFYVNNSQRLHKSGFLSWMDYTFTAEEDGEYTFKWVYEKDPATSTGDDCACLDDVYVTYAEPEPPEPTFIPGDCNDDGIVDVADAVIALQYAMFGSDDNLVNFDAADMNEDGVIDVSDAVIILRIAMGTND